MIAQGVVVGARGGTIEANLPAVSIGAGIRVSASKGEVSGIVTAVYAGRAIVAAHDAIDGVCAGDMAYVDPAALTLPLGTMLVGRAIDSNGTVLDGGAPLRGLLRPRDVKPPLPTQRGFIDRPCWTGVRAIDGLLTIGRGARIGIFGSPGAGKSTLLQTIVRGTHADAVVLGLIGERGREAEEWMRSAPAYASMVCATSDRPAAQRAGAGRVAMAQAHALRARGLHVLFILDSFARFAAALRELALANGEPVGRGGYPASVFSELAAFTEVAGSLRTGSITLVATVLSDGDERDPVSDAARSLLDGHIQLSAARAQARRFPAIDIGASVSRTMGAVVSAEHAANAALVSRAVTSLASTADARALGIAPAGAFDLRAAAFEESIERFLSQGDQTASPAATLTQLHELADGLR